MYCGADHLKPVGGAGVGSAAHTADGPKLVRVDLVVIEPTVLYMEAQHLAQRGFWIHCNDPVAGAIKLPGPPCRFAEGGGSIRRLAPGLGEHDAEVGAELAALARPAAQATSSKLAAGAPTQKEG